ncbi:MAG: hypothetical protein OXE59_04610 [Bacteroidetes bacterium]|nr:hypothetical protein [Bacteroidota bacterium]
MRAIALWLLVIFLIPKSSTPQKDSEYYAFADTDSVFVQGNSLIGQQNENEFLQFITGDVLVTYRTNKVTADRAVRNVTKRRTSFTGNAVLIDQGDTLQANSLDYDEELDVGRAEGNVRLSDGDIIAHSSLGIYYADEDRVVFPDGLTLIDSTMTLTGDNGQYWTDQKVADVAGNVMMESEQGILFSDSLLHYREVSISKAQGSVRYVTFNDTDSTWIAGERLEYNAEDSLSIIRGNPVMVNLSHDSLSVDTLIIRADVIHIRDKQSSSRLDAVDNVRIWNGSLSATADSIAYDRQSERSSELIWLFGQPYIWLNLTQLTGDTMKVVIEDGQIDSMMIWGNAFVAEQDSSINRINQVKGRTLVSSRQRDSLRIFRIGPNAEAIYFSTDGALEASGDAIRMEFEGDTLKTLSFSTDVQGMRYPQNALPNDLSLDGLQWKSEKKPSKAQLLGDLNLKIEQWEH